MSEQDWLNLLQEGGKARSEEEQKIVEGAVRSLMDHYVQSGQADALTSLFEKMGPFFEAAPKSKAAKMVIGLLNALTRIPNTLPQQMALCERTVAWATAESRSILRQRVQARQAALLLEARQYPKCLALLAALLPEAKKFDEKLLLVEIFLVDARLQLALQNHGKAKASLTAARTSANAVYCPLPLQAQVDLLAGVLLAEDLDYKTAFSYFFEAFESFHTVLSSNSAAKDDPANRRGAETVLQLMLLCKIMQGKLDEVRTLVAGKTAQRYHVRCVIAMEAIAAALEKKSLRDFGDAMGVYADVLGEDPIVQRHMSLLEDSLLEKNLALILEPYRVIDLARIETLINLPRARVEKKLSQMILDKKLLGILDQGADSLILFDEQPEETLYPAASTALANLNSVVTVLFEKAVKI